MLHLKSIDFRQNRPKIKLFFQKSTKFSSAGGSAPLQISGYVSEFNHVFALLISMPPEFSLMPRFKSINFYQNKPKIKLVLKKNKIF